MIDHNAARILREIAWIRLTPVPPASAIEITQPGDHMRAYFCEEAGDHSWARVEDDDPNAGEYWCEQCGAHGQLIRPMGAQR